MSNYYIIKPAVDTQETGNVFPSAESYNDYDFNSPNSAHKLTFREFANFEPDIRFKLARGAKLTDMLSQAAISADGFLINEKLKKTFEQFDIVPHKYYPAKIEDRQGRFYDYFWMHLVGESMAIVNWQKSKFFFMHYEEKKLLAFDNLEAYLKKKKELGMFVPIQIDHLEIMDTKYDIFVHPFQALSIISDTVKKALVNNNISGIRTEPLH
jgi:hypothetical protein